MGSELDIIHKTTFDDANLYATKAYGVIDANPSNYLESKKNIQTNLDTIKKNYEDYGKKLIFQHSIGLLYKNITNVFIINIQVSTQKYESLLKEGISLYEKINSITSYENQIEKLKIENIKKNISDSNNRIKTYSQNISELINKSNTASTMVSSAYSNMVFIQSIFDIQTHIDQNVKLLDNIKKYMNIVINAAETAPTYINTINDELFYSKKIASVLLELSYDCSAYNVEDPNSLYDVLNTTDPSIYNHMMACLQQQIIEKNAPLVQLTRNYGDNKLEAISASEQKLNTDIIYKDNLFYTTSKIFMFILLIAAYIYFFKDSGIFQPIKDGVQLITTQLDKVKDIKMPKIKMPEVTMPSIKMPTK